MQNITTDQLSKKLDHKMLGFLKVMENKKISIELQLPQSIKIYNIFYPNPLQKAFKDLLTNQVNKTLPLVIIINEEDWKVEDILDTRSY